MAEKKSKINFEKAIKDLEEIVEDLESGELSLEDSLKAFEKGIKLTRLCQGELEEAELKVKKLVEENGELKTKPLTND
tara:strand:- start:2715 stop:2948 length:234 start_codon:yes stop_codon:yes gene_type:complete